MTNSEITPPRLLCVLGMHRSGTSCLTGSLQEAGVDLGNCHTWNPHNLKGNRENQDVVDLNDDVLAVNNASWDAPSSRVRWSDAHYSRARALIEQHAASPCFGFKDPRTLLTLDGWLTAFPDLSFIGIFRDPINVAQSLHNRSGMPLEQGLSLWYQYNRRLWSYYRSHGFPVLCFDDDAEVFKVKLRKTLLNLGLTTELSSASFYDEALRSAEGDRSIKVGWRVSRLFKKLKQIAE